MRPPIIDQWLSGPLLAENDAWPLVVPATVQDLRPRFLAKGRAGRGYRAVARNGRVLLASDLPLPELAGRAVRIRLQTWHRSLLPGDLPEPYGILMDVRNLPEAAGTPSHRVRLAVRAGARGELIMEVGGGMVLEFSRVTVSAAGPQ